MKLVTFSLLMLVSISSTFANFNNGVTNEAKKHQKQLNEDENAFTKIAQANESTLLFLGENNPIDGNSLYGISTIRHITDNYQVEEERGLFCKVKDTGGEVVASCIICNCRKLAIEHLAKEALKELQDSKSQQ